MTDKNFILSLETTVGGGSISLLENIREIDFKLGSGRVSKAADILYEVEELLVSNGIEKKDLRLITISNGFGSFTGARVGWAMAKGIGRSLGCRVLGVPLLEAMCLIEGATDKILVCIPNGNREVCFQEFKVGKNSLKIVSIKPEFTKMESFKELIEKEFDKTLIIENYLYERISNKLEHFSKNRLKLIKADKNLAKYVGIKGALTEPLASDNEGVKHSSNF